MERVIALYIFDGKTPSCCILILSLLSAWLTFWIMDLISLSTEPPAEIVLPRYLKFSTQFNWTPLMVMVGLGFVFRAALTGPLSSQKMSGCLGEAIDDDLVVAFLVGHEGTIICEKSFKEEFSLVFILTDGEDQIQSHWFSTWCKNLDRGSS